MQGVTVLQILTLMTIFRLRIDTDVTISGLMLVLINPSMIVYAFLLLIMSCLNIASWNATGIMSSASYASALLKKKDVHFFGISEHWLYHQNIHFSRYN